MPIEEPMKMLPPKQAAALKKWYDMTSPEKKDNFLMRANLLTRQYYEKTPAWRQAAGLTPFPSKVRPSNDVKISNQRDLESEYITRTWGNPRAKNADPMALTNYEKSKIFKRK